MAPHSDRLRDEFDRRLGRRSSIAKRSNARNPRAQAKLHANTVKSGRSSTRARIRSGSKNLPADLKREYKRQFGEKQSVHDFQKSMNNIVDDTIKQLQDKVFTERAITDSLEAGEIPDVAGPSPVDKPGNIQKGINFLENAVPGLGMFTRGPEAGTNLGQLVDNVKRQQDAQNGDVPFWQGLMEDFSRSPAGRSLDLVSRPAYGVAEGLQNALEEDYRLRDEGTQQNNPLRFLDDLGEGFWKGFSGQEKTGFGQTWQTMRQSSDIVGAQELRDLEESHPLVTRWLDRGVGLAGEVTMDPLNAVGLGAAPQLRTGGNLTEQAAKASVSETVDTITRDFYDDVLAATVGPKSSRYKPSQDSLAIYAAQKAEDDIEKSLLEISGGTHAGYGKMGGDYYARATAERVTEEIRSQWFKSFDNRVDKALKALNSGGNLPPSSWRTHIAQSPEFSDMVDEALAIKNAKRTNPISKNEFILNMSQADARLLQEAALRVKSRIGANLAQDVTDRIYEQTRQLYYNTLAVRVGRKKIPLKAFGKAYAYAKDNLPESVRNTGKSISYERNFPGRLSILTQEGRSIGAKAFEDFRDRWQKIAREISQEDDKLLYKALGDSKEAALLPNKLYPVFLRMRHELDEMAKDEMISGARGEGYTHAVDYVPVFNKGGEARRRTNFKAERKKYIRSHGNAGGYNSAGAAREGLKPVESAVEALLIRKQKSTREIARASFMKDLVENYGFMTKPLSAQEARFRHLKAVDIERLPQYMRTEMKKTGQTVYLPQEHLQLYDDFVNVSKWDSRDAQLFIREWAKLTNHIKYLSTVPRAGFHVRNFIGDLFMGMLDKIPLKTYSEVMQKYIKAQAGHTARFRISKNIDLTWDQLKSLYDKHANSGFFETEIPLGGNAPTAGQHFNNARKRASNFMRNVSDSREDFGRIVHFLGALRQEADILSKGGNLTIDRLMDKAVESAVWRVNKYKFDYGALTATERKVKLAFPFYTFTRKAMPTLMQQLALNPKWMAVANRFMTYNDGSAADLFNHYMLPEYVKDSGYAMLNNEEEPLYIDQGILPTSALNTLDFTNMQQFAQSIAAQSNPMLQLPFEVAGARDVFSGRPTGDFNQYLTDTFFAQDIANEIMPGAYEAGPLSRENPNSDPWWLQAMNEGYLGANLGVRKFSQAQQEFGVNDMKDRLIDDPFRDFNMSQERYRIYQSNSQDGRSFKVEDVLTGNVVIQGQDPREVLAKAQRL